MEISGDYRANGYALVRKLIPLGVARAIMKRLEVDLGPAPWVLNRSQPAAILNRNALEIYGNSYPPMQSFLWALTPVMETIAESSLLPTYCYFRIYREDDVCRIHRDRPACEHSLSLTLDYSDDVPWPLDVGADRTHRIKEAVADDFGDEDFASLSMNVGDAVAYQGVDHRHGRRVPNPNQWSAHLFMHWVEVDGPHASHAFDGQGIPQPINVDIRDS